LFLTDQKHFFEFPLPACFQNHGNYVISLARWRWLGQQAEALGVEIFPLRRRGSPL
jgi:electron-transferring-flavoprotein dehydrogenase